MISEGGLHPGPHISDFVHYRSYGTPGGEYKSTCRAAVVTEVESGGERVGLAVLNPTGMFFHSLADGGSVYHDGAETPGVEDCPTVSDHGNPLRYCGCGWREASYPGGSWHWPGSCDPPSAEWSSGSAVLPD